MFMSNILVCLQVAVVTEKSGGASVTWGGDKGLGPPATLIGGYMVGRTSPCN